MEIAPNLRKLYSADVKEKWGSPQCSGLSAKPLQAELQEALERQSVNLHAVTQEQDGI